jgi:hypothetical protein
LGASGGSRVISAGRQSFMVASPLSRFIGYRRCGQRG